MTEEDEEFNRIEREALAEQPAQQEPVCDKDPQGCWSVRCQLGKQCKNTPAQRTWVGLTDEEIEAVWKRVQANDFHDCVQPFARAIEAAHGIKNNSSQR